MAQASDVLGLNTREAIYRKLNKKQAKRYAYSKLKAKRVLGDAGVPVPELVAKFTSMEQVDDFDFSKLDMAFVVKPVGGNAGKGILIVKRKSKKEGYWVNVDGKLIDERDIRLHISDILEGQYSTYGTKHMAFIEERVGIHPKFKRFTKKGTPDIRVIVFNKVPVMAMLRIPTKESEGRANLHQGAIGIGIDMSSGVTIKGVHRGKLISKLPGTKKKLNGLRIPKWTAALRTAVRACEVVGLSYAGVDLFMHPDKGPVVVELNANPGLSIQLANRSGLKRRLTRVEGLEIRDVDHGVKVGRALFAEWFADKVKADDGLVIIDTFEKVKVRSKDKKWVEVNAKVDTGAFRSGIDRKVAEELGLLVEDNVLWGKKRPVVEVKLKVKDKRIKTAVRIINRSKAQAKVVLGRRDLGGFLINPELKSSN